jgi:hypothetical protein
MKQLPKITTLVITFLLFTSTVKAQLSLSYHHSAVDKIGLGYNFSDRFWGELRMYNSDLLNNFSPEVVFCYNIVKKERHEFYTGAGVTVGTFTGFVFPVGVQFYPISEFRRFSLHVDFQPIIEFEGSILAISSFGIRYRFGKKFQEK